MHAEHADGDSLNDLSGRIIGSALNTKTPSRQDSNCSSRLSAIETLGR